MNQDSEKRNSRSHRLEGYDYSWEGAYYVTICSYNRKCLFGEIICDEMQLNDYGRIVKEEWFKTCQLRPNIELDEFVVMPNHVHGIIVIINELNHGNHPARWMPTNDENKMKPGSLPVIVRAFKSAVTKRINEIYNMLNMPVWQRGYYDHIIRNEKSLNQIREYIIENPRLWLKDDNNPINIKQSVGVQRAGHLH